MAPARRRRALRAQNSEPWHDYDSPFPTSDPPRLRPLPPSDAPETRPRTYAEAAAAGLASHFNLPRLAQMHTSMEIPAPNFTQDRGFHQRRPLKSTPDTRGTSECSNTAMAPTKPLGSEGSGQAETVAVSPTTKRFESERLGRRLSERPETSLPNHVKKKLEDIRISDPRGKFKCHKNPLVEAPAPSQIIPAVPRPIDRRSDLFMSQLPRSASPILNVAGLRRGTAEDTSSSPTMKRVLRLRTDELKMRADKVRIRADELQRASPKLCSTSEAPDKDKAKSKAERPAPVQVSAKDCEELKLARQEKSEEKSGSGSKVGSAGGSRYPRSSMDLVTVLAQFGSDPESDDFQMVDVPESEKEAVAKEVNGWPRRHWDWFEREQ